MLKLTERCSDTSPELKDARTDLSELRLRRTDLPLRRLVSEDWPARLPKSSFKLRL